MGGFEKSRLKKKKGKNKSLVLDALGALLAATAAGLLGQEDGLDVGQNTSLGDGDALEQLVQFLIVADGQLEVARVDSLLLVVAGGVSSQLEDFGGQVLHDCGQIDWSAGSDALGVVARAKETVNSPHGELEPSSGGAALGLSTGLASLSTSRHSDSK